jgi:SAM-dependent methyltransferase
MFSNEWDDRFKQGKSISTWPWSDLIALVKRHTNLKKGNRVLELGCGTGANIPFFLLMGVDFFGLEGSQTAVKYIHQYFPEVKDRVIVGDFTDSLEFCGRFDLIIDRSAITHNDTKAIKKCLKMIHKKLKPKGVYIGIDWFSNLHSECINGKPTTDSRTLTFDKGHFAGCGKVHFSDRPHLKEIFEDAGFNIIRLDHKTVRSESAEAIGISATWHIVAEKK